MRPKKKILLVSADEFGASTCAFMLTVNGYAVLKAGDATTAVDIFKRKEPDLVLSDYDLGRSTGAVLVKKLRTIRPYIPMILLGDPKVMIEEVWPSYAILSKKDCSALELLERIKVMSARKGGPRKGTNRRIPVSSVTQPVPAMDVWA